MNREWLSRHRRFLVIGLVLLILLIILFSSSGEKSKPPSWTEIQQGTFLVQAAETGEVRAVQQLDVKAPMEWRMPLQVVWLAPEGSMVQKGDLLVQFDIAELQKRQDLAEDRLISAVAQEKKLLAEQDAKNQQLQGNLLTAEYSRDLAQLQKELMKYESAVKQQDVELDRQKALLELDEAKTTLESQKIIDAAALNSAKVAIAKERTEMKELERQIASLSLRAPNSGMVIYNEVGWWDNQKKVSTGDKVNPGEPIVSIPNLDSMQVNLRVNEMDISRIKSGQRTVVTLDAYPDKKFNGVVTHIARLAQKQNWDSMIKDFEVIVRLEQADPLLKPGMTAKAMIVVQQLENVLFVPLGSVFEKEGKPVIFRKKNHPSATPVTLSERNEGWVVVAGAGLQPGEALAWRCPDDESKRIGYSEEIKYAHATAGYWQQSFGNMSQKGLQYDFDARRNEAPTATRYGNQPVRAPMFGGAPGQIVSIGSPGQQPGAVIRTPSTAALGATAAMAPRPQGRTDSLAVDSLKNTIKPGAAAPPPQLPLHGPDSLSKKQ
jgi:HlyD family secretion protein